MNWTCKLLLWYAENKRSFLWRDNREPYNIWLSEVILQQTRTDQGLPYFERFLTAFPTIEALAMAKEDEVLKLWQGLGYYSRARNLHFTAQYIHNELDGVFPKTFESLLELKGVGDYTASAIASICFDIPQAVVDGNVFRFLSRYFGILTPINSSSAHKEFKNKAMELMGQNHPGTFNQALMEFGSLHCTPKKPKCPSCPFAKNCIAFNQDKINLLPVKTSKIKIKKRYFNYLVVSDPKHQFMMQKRTQKGIWQNLYEFPLVESSKTINSVDELTSQVNFPQKLKLLSPQIKLWNQKPIIHKLSHQSLLINFWEINIEKSFSDGYNQDALMGLAVPVVIQNFIRKFFSIDL